VNRAAQANAWGGMAGHYALIGQRHIEGMHHRGFQIGTGFVNSRNCLYREVARGVDWLFSDQALALQKITTRYASIGWNDCPR
jgi:glycerophosphoryl diester phosphodiesterase